MVQERRKLNKKVLYEYKKRKQAKFLQKKKQKKREVPVLNNKNK